VGLGCSAYSLVQHATCNDNTFAQAPRSVIICAVRSGSFDLAISTDEQTLIFIERGSKPANLGLCWLIRRRPGRSLQYHTFTD